MFARMTDTFYPNGSNRIFNDFTPSTRTDILKKFAGVQVRPIIDAPVYLLFQPRRHSTHIRVVIHAALENGLPTTTTTIAIGYRHGDNLEGNYTKLFAPKKFENGWYEWECTLPFSEMTVERTDARRIVFDFGARDGELWNVRDVRIFYDE